MKKKKHLTPEERRRLVNQNRTGRLRGVKGRGASAAAPEQNPVAAQHQKNLSERETALMKKVRNYYSDSDNYGYNPSADHTAGVMDMLKVLRENSAKTGNYNYDKPEQMEAVFNHRATGEAKGRKYYADQVESAEIFEDLRKILLEEGKKRKTAVPNAKEKLTNSQKFAQQNAQKKKFSPLSQTKQSKPKVVDSSPSPLASFSITKIKR